MKNFKFSVLFLTLLFTLSTVTAFAGSNSDLYATWRCVESYATSDDYYAPNEKIDIYDYIYSKQGAGMDGFSNRASDFELHAGDVIEVYAYAGFDYYGDPISESNSADHYIDIYCGDTYLGGLFIPVYSDLKENKDYTKIVVTKNDISVSGNNNLRLEYQIGNFYYTYAVVDNIKINGQYLQSR